MRKWAFFVLAAAAAIIGCAGSGGDSGSTGGSGSGGGTATTGGGMQVTIPTPPGQVEPPGSLYFGYLTGQGRSVGDLSLAISRVNVSDEFGDISGDLNTKLSLALNSYTLNWATLIVPFNGENSRLFENYTLDPDELVQDNGGGSFSKFQRSDFRVLKPDGSLSAAWPPNPTQMAARAFPGRSTFIPIFVDDSMFAVTTDSTGNTVVAFDEARFLSINQPPIKAFLNDYVSFDISAMLASKRPNLSPLSGSLVAGRVMLTGDNYAVAPSTDFGNFELLTQFADQPIVGTYRVPSQLPGHTTPGTFTLNALDPTDLFNLRKIVALQGMWRPYQSVMSGFGAWNMIAFPSSVDGFNQEVVYFKRDGAGKITDFYFGYLDYDTSVMHLYPVKGLVNGTFDVADEIIVSITAQYTKSGGVTVAPQETRSGNFNVTTRGALPADAPGTGSFFVFRI